MNVFIIAVLFLSISTFAQTLPQNFEYKRQTGQVDGIPIFLLMPRSEVVTQNAARGNTFESLGAIAQPEADIFILVFYNAKKTLQLHLQQEKGALLKIDGIEFKVSEYKLGDQSSVGQLNLESARIPIDKTIFWRIGAAKDVFVRIGNVSYNLDEDNINALHYYSAQITKDIARRKRPSLTVPPLTGTTQEPLSPDVYQATASLRPIILYQEKAKYTHEARKNAVEGIVLLSAVFTGDGKVIDIRVIRGLPDGLNNEATRAIQKIRFTPAIKNGKPVSVRMSVEFTFKL